MKTTNNLSRLSIACIAVALSLSVAGARGQPSKTPKPPTTQTRTIAGKTSDPAKSSSSTSSSQNAYKAQGSGGGTVPKSARDHNSNKGSKGGTSQANSKANSAITADNLTIVGLTPASAAALAGKAAHGDEEAQKTAKLVVSGSALLQQTGATPEQTTAALEEITKRRLTDDSKGSAFRSVVDGAALKSVLGPDIKLPPGQLDGRVAGSIFDVMGDLAGAGIDPYQSNYKNNIYQTIIDKGYGMNDARGVARDVASKDLQAAVGRPATTPFDFSSVDTGTGAMTPGSGFAPGNTRLPGRLGDIYKDPTNPNDNSSGKTQNPTSGDIFSFRSGANNTEKGNGSTSSGSRGSDSGSSSSGGSSGEYNSGYHHTDDDSGGTGGHNYGSDTDNDSSSSGSNSGSGGSSGSNNSSGSGNSGSNNSGSSGSGSGASSSGDSGSSSSGSSGSSSGNNSGGSSSGGSNFFDGVDPNAGNVTQEDRDKSWSTPNDKQHEANKETDGNNKSSTERPRDPDDATRRPTEAEKRQLISGGASMIIGKRNGAQPENPSGGGDDNVWTGGSGPLPDKKGKLLGGDTREPIATRAKPVISSSTPLRKPGSAGPENPSGGGDDSGYQPGNQNSSPPGSKPSVAR